MAGESDRILLVFDGDIGPITEKVRQLEQTMQSTANTLASTLAASSGISGFAAAVPEVTAGYAGVLNQAQLGGLNVGALVPQIREQVKTLIGPQFEAAGFGGAFNARGLQEIMDSIIAQATEFRAAITQATVAAKTAYNTQAPTEKQVQLQYERIVAEQAALGAEQETAVAERQIASLRRAYAQQGIAAIAGAGGVSRGGVVDTEAEGQAAIKANVDKDVAATEGIVQRRGQLSEAILAQTELQKQVAEAEAEQLSAAQRARAITDAHLAASQAAAEAKSIESEVDVASAEAAKETLQAQEKEAVASSRAADAKLRTAQAALAQNEAIAGSIGATGQRVAPVVVTPAALGDVTAEERGYLEKISIAHQNRIIALNRVAQVEIKSADAEYAVLARREQSLAGRALFQARTNFEATNPGENFGALSEEEQKAKVKLASSEIRAVEKAQIQAAAQSDRLLSEQELAVIARRRIALEQRAEAKALQQAQLTGTVPVPGAASGAQPPVARIIGPGATDQEQQATLNSYLNQEVYQRRQMIDLMVRGAAERARTTVAEGSIAVSAQTEAEAQAAAARALIEAAGLDKGVLNATAKVAAEKIKLAEASAAEAVAAEAVSAESVQRVQQTELLAGVVQRTIAAEEEVATASQQDAVSQTQRVQQNRLLDSVTTQYKTQQVKALAQIAIAENEELQVARGAASATRATLQRVGRVNQTETLAPINTDVAIQADAIKERQAAAQAAAARERAALSIDQEAAAAIEDRIVTNRLATAKAQAALTTEGAIAAEVERKVAEEQYNIALREATAAAREEAGLTRQRRGLFGTVGGRIFGGGGGGGGGAPGDETGGAGAFFGGGLASIARFAIPATLAFGAYRQIKEAIKDASELERVLAVTKQQFDDLGKGDQFQGFRQGIIDISQRTGETASEVALVGQQLQAAFGGDTARALRETDAAMEAIRISGLSGQQVVNDFTAIIKSFGDGSTSIRQLTDSAVGLQERFGVLVKDTIEFSGAIAPIAAETGFTAKQIEALGAAYQEFSGRAGSTGAENLGRILSGIQEKALPLVTLLNSQLPDLAGQIANSLSSGNIEQVFEELLTNYGRLTETQQEQLLLTIGGRRETAALAAIFKDSANVLKEFRGQTDDTGKSQEAFANTQKTLSQQIAELGKQFKTFGIGLFESGLGDLLKAIVGDVSSLVGIGQGLVGMFQSLNEVTHGTVGVLVQVAAQLAAIYAGIRLIMAIGAVKALVGGLGGALGGGVAAEGAGAGVGAGIAGAGLLARFKAGYAGTAATEGVAIEGSSLTTAGVLGGTEGATGGILGGLTAAAGSAPLLAGSFVVVGGLIAKTVLGDLRDGMHKHIQDNIRGDIGKQHAQTDSDIQTLLGNFELVVPSEGGGSQITGAKQDQDARLEKLAQFKGQRIATADQLRDVLAADSHAYDTLIDSIHDSASGFQSVLESVGGPDQDLDNKITRTKESVVALQNQAAAKLEPILGDPAKIKQFLDELRSSGAYDVLFGGPNQKRGTSYEDAQGQLNSLLQEVNDVGDKPLSAEQQQRLQIVAQQLSGFQGRADKAATDAQRKALIAEQQNQLLAQDATALKSQFDAGIIGLAQYLNGLDALQKSLDLLAQNNMPADVDAAVKNHTLTIKATSDALLNQATFLTDAAQIAGTDTPQQDVQRLTEVLQNPQFADSTDRQKAAKDLITAIKAEKSFEASLVTDAVEKAKILNEASAVPQEAQEALLEAFLNSNFAFQTFLDETFKGQTNLQKAITTIVATELSNGIKSVKEATIQAERFELASLTAQLVALDELYGFQPAHQAEIESLRTQVLSLEDSIAKDLAQQVPDITVPDFSSTRASAPDRAAADKAAADQIRQDAKKLRDAQRAYFLALAGGDPIKQAQAAQQAADEALAEAQDPTNGLNDVQRQAAELDAQAQRITADNQFANAIKVIAKSQSNLVIAMLNAAGDTVGAAREAANEAQREYDQALAETASGHGPGDTALRDLQANAINTAAAARETALQDKIQHEQFLHDIGQVTTGQFIAFLQTLLLDPTLIRKDREELQRQIYQLQHTIGQDLKFNIPSVLGLPGLYESRRTDQLGGSGSYQDNRQISVQVYANTNASPQQIATAVAGVFGTPAANSTYAKRYGV